jgi:hypothetical protein
MIYIIHFNDGSLYMPAGFGSGKHTRFKIVALQHTREPGLKTTACFPEIPYFCTSITPVKWKKKNLPER